MTSEYILLTVLFLIYLSECIAVVPSSAFILKYAFSGRWIAHKQEFLLIFGSRLVFENLLPSRGSVVVAEVEPPRVSPNGFLCFASKSALGVAKYVGFEAADPFFASDHDVKTGSYYVCSAATAKHAAEIAGFLNRLRVSDKAIRESIIDESFKRLLDARRASVRWNAYRKVSPLLLADSWALFGTFLLFFCLLLLHFGLAATWFLAIPGLFFLSHSIYAFHRTHSIFYRNCGQERWKHIMLMVLTPTSSVRASDALIRELFAGLHFLPVARALLNKDQSRDFTAKTLREMLHRTEIEESAPASTVSEWSRSRWTQFVSEWAENEFGDLSDLLAAPLKENPSCVCYCPRCLAQYVINQDTCPDCPGVRLARF